MNEVNGKIMIRDFSLRGPFWISELPALTILVITVLICASVYTHMAVARSPVVYCCALGNDSRLQSSHLCVRSDPPACPSQQERRTCRRPP